VSLTTSVKVHDLKSAVQVIRDQPNAKFHGRDIFHETERCPQKSHSSVKSRDFCEFLTFGFIYKGYLYIPVVGMYIFSYEISQNYCVLRM